MSSFTPGPWQVVATPFKEGFSVLAQPHAALRGFTKVVSFVGDKADEETEANARLIAAAPELKCTASDLLASLDPDTLNPEQFNAWCRLNVAIAKAEGRS